MKDTLRSSTSTLAGSPPDTAVLHPVLEMPQPLRSILSDVQRAFAAGLYYPALVVALTLPEICVSLRLAKHEFVKQSHYVTFIDTYTVPSDLGMDGLSSYRLRGGMIHRGNAAGHPFFGSTHVIFTVPESGSGVHALTLAAGDKTAAMFDLKIFCSEMERAVLKWYADHKYDPVVATNIRNLLSWRPQGITPFVGGGPVIASGPD